MKARIGEQINMIFYISDIHFNDQRVFDKCSRPFKNLEEYKEKIILNWNRKVKEDDIVYVLGDIAEDSYEEVIDILKKLNGVKHFIVGNHDEKLLPIIKKADIFKTINYINLIEDHGRKVCICHYPLMDWMEFSRGGYHIYGHIHNKTQLNGYSYIQIKEYFSDKPAFNASVDVIGYEPVTLDEMIKLKEVNKNEPYIN